MRSVVRGSIFASVAFVAFIFIYGTYRFSAQRPRVSEIDGILAGQDDWPARMDKVVVMAKIKEEDTEWVREELPE